MVSKRSVYLNFFAVFAALMAFFVLNATLINNAIPDALYSFLARPLPPARDNAAVLAASDALERENAALRIQLGLSPKKRFNLTLVRIISLQRNLLASTVIIDHGSKEGIQPGMPVLGAGNVLVGKIQDVFLHSSRVLLADDPRFIASVRLLSGASSSLAESRGSFANGISLNLIAHNESIAIGDLVATSGLDEFPDGLAFARVSEVSRGQHSLFQKISGTLMLTLNESPILFVIR